MRARLFALFLAVCSPLFLPPGAAALGCWLCDNQLDACTYYAISNRSWCNDGCQRNPYNGCLAWCTSTYYNDLYACQSSYEWCTERCDRGNDDPEPNCPIVLDLGQHGWRFTSAGEGVMFDMDGKGLRDWIAWTDPTSEDGFLAWDRNLNGVIDSGRELFGDSTVQPPSEAPNGFLALAWLDQVDSGGNGDGLISDLDGL